MQAKMVTDQLQFSVAIQCFANPWNAGLVHVALNCSVCGVEKTQFKAAKNR